jgi:hypothetical protein
MLPSKLAQEVTVVTYIWEVLGSNLGRILAVLSEVFPRSFRVNVGTVV